MNFSPMKSWYAGLSAGPKTAKGRLTLAFMCTCPATRHVSQYSYKIKSHINMPARGKHFHSS